MEKLLKCRICKGYDFHSVLDLGLQPLSGVFPDAPNIDVPEYPLSLVRCQNCTLVQLSVTCPLTEMYGQGYGYRSSATSAMKAHLKAIANEARAYFTGDPDLAVLDIGCNDGFLLEQFSPDRCFGFDPVGLELKKVKEFNFKYFSSFFGAQTLREATDQKMDVVTSISMFYDIENPIDFAKEVTEVMSNDGVWILEVSYLGSVIQNLVYDSICHEHLAYYSLQALEYVAQQAELDIYAVSQNNLNGGSLRLHLVKKTRSNRNAVPKITLERLQELRKMETVLGISNGDCFIKFEKRLKEHRVEVQNFFDKHRGKQTIVGYGASTKGNTLLQFCGITRNDLPVIGDVSEHKYGCFTPGTKIPIISMEQALAMRANFYFVLPWGFKKHILDKERLNRSILRDSKFVFPLPSLSVNSL